MSKALKLGSSGERVANLQKELMLLGYTPNIISKGVSADGSFGESTDAVVKAVQARCGLDVDGIVGPLTDSAIAVSLTNGYLPTVAPVWSAMTSQHWPVTSQQGWRSLGDVQQFHRGVDLGTPQGTNIYSPISGNVVVMVRNHSIAGGLIIVRNYETKWGFALCHMSRIDVELGDNIKRGEMLGFSGGLPGSFGAGYSTGPHLHVSAQYDGISVNPTAVIKLKEATGIMAPDRLT